MLFTILFGVNLGAVFAPLQTVVVREIYHQDVVEAGLFGMVLGIGSVLGCIAYLLGGLRTKPVAVMAVTALLHALFALGTVASPHFSTSLVSVLLLGLFGTWYVNVSKMLIHMAVPHKHRGRAMRLWMVAFGFVPIVGAFAGWVCDISKEPQTVLVCFAVLSGVIVVSTIANWAFDKLFKAHNGKAHK